MRDSSFSVTNYQLFRTGERRATPTPGRGEPSQITRAKALRAFTLIELLIVITIIGILTGVSIPAFNAFNRRQALAQAAKNLKTDIRAARNQAVAGVNGKRWGVHFVQGSGSYEIFSTDDSSAYSPGQPKVLPSGVHVSDLCSPFDTCEKSIANVVFKHLTGEVGVYDNAGSSLDSNLAITLSISGVADRYVKVEAGGKIYEE